MRLKGMKANKQVNPELLSEYRIALRLWTEARALYSPGAEKWWPQPTIWTRWNRSSCS